MWSYWSLRDGLFTRIIKASALSRSFLYLNPLFINLNLSLKFANLAFWGLVKFFEFSSTKSFEFFMYASQHEICKLMFVWLTKDIFDYLLLSYRLRVVFCHFFSHNFYIIRISKTTHPIEFLDNSNFFNSGPNQTIVSYFFKQKLVIKEVQ